MADNGHLIGTNPLASDLHDSIEHLAEGLNSSNAHFIFELIQNAEDNTYKVAKPSLSFDLIRTDPTGTPGSDGALVIRNNEIGFSRENVDAICAVGKTTKRKIEGYIGEKGIGFKSVFRITSKPHIFSNGYRFCMPEYDKETGLGFIVPRWIDEIPESITVSQTTIILPLDKSGFGYKKVEEMLQEIAPETILFLSKLKEIVISIETGDAISIVNEDSKAPLIKILVSKNNNTPDIYEFLLDTRPFKKPPHINPEKRKDIEVRNVSIAFPLKEGSESAGKIFAYLPVHTNTGLPFVINADFLLTSSREDIQKDEPWNQWLRDCVTEVFANAFKKWVNVKKYRTRIFGFIPLQAYTNFLSPIVASIQAILKDIEIVPTEPDGRKRKPDHARTALKNFRTLLFGKTYPQVLQNPGLVLDEIETYQKQLRAIGVKQITLDLVKKCLQDRGWIAQHDYDSLLECYRYLSSQKFDGGLTDCAIVPIKTSGKTRWSCDDKQPIYFECDEGINKILKEVPDCIGVRLAFLDKQFYEKIKNDEKIRDWMTNALRIYSFSRQNYAVDVLTWLKSHYGEIKDSDLVSATLFLSQFTDTVNDFGDIPVILSDGRRMLLSEARSLPGVQSVVTPEKLDPGAGWQHIWKTNQDRRHFVILDNCYTKEACEFFIKINAIVDYPVPYFQKDDGYYSFTQDYMSPEWMTKDDCEVDQHEGRALIKFLKKYSENINSWQRTQYSRRDGRHCFAMAEQEKATFLKNIIRLPMLPTSQGMISPRKAFLLKNATKEILGDSVPYFEGDLPENIIRLLGIRTEATAEELISVLEHYECNSNGSKDFAERVYRYLHSLELSKINLDRLRQKNLIFVPMASDVRWVSSNDVIWKDNRGVLGDDFIYLEKVYPKLKDFFINTIQIKEDVDPECYAKRWLKLQGESGRNKIEIENIFTTIYREILPLCQKNEQTRPDWWKKFSEEARMWTQDKRFEIPQSVYVPDDGELKQIFQQNDVSFAWRPEKDSFSDWEALYRALGLPYLSESVNISLSDDIEYDDVKKQSDFLTDSAKILIATWIREERPTDYQRLLKEQRIQALLKTDEVVGSSKEVIYCLGEKEVRIPKEVVWYEPKNILLVAEEANRRKKNVIALTLARDLMPNRAYKDLADWIELVLGENDWQWRIQQKSWRIPDEVRDWMESLSQKKLEKQQEPHDTDLLSSENGNAQTNHSDERDDRPDSNINTRKPDSSLQPKSTSNKRPENENQEDPLYRDLPKTKTPISENFDYQTELINVFNRPGATTLLDGSEPDDRPVTNTDRRREKEAEEHKRRIADEPESAKRRKEVMRAILEGPDEQVRKTLEEWYGGKCQICGSTFPERTGKPFFIANYIVPRKLARQEDAYANALCLCAEHFAKWQHGAVEADDVILQINAMKPKVEGGNRDLQLMIKVCGEKCTIQLTEKHVIALQEMLNASSEQQSILNKGVS